MSNHSMFNVLVLSFSFLLIFTAFNTASMLQKTIVDGINKDFNVGWNGFLGLCILYAVFSISNFFAPSVLHYFKARLCLFTSALCYLIYIVIFLHPLPYMLNIVSGILGIGAAVIWTSQGSFLTENSTKETLDRNTGIFWAIFQGSLLFGNFFVFIYFRDVTQINQNRFTTYVLFTITCSLGSLLLLLLRPVNRSSADESDGSDSGVEEDSAAVLTSTETHFTQVWDQIKGCFKLLRNIKVVLLLFVFFYSGLILSFYSGVYVTAIGATKAFGDDSSKYIGLCGMFIGTGEIIGGGLFGLMGKRFNRHGRSPIIVFGFVVHVVAFVFTYLNLPNDSSINSTNQSSYLTPNIAVALACGFAYGLGDACLNTQIYSIIGSLFPPESQLTSSMFALYKFTQSIAAAISFFYSQIGLTMLVHTLILTVFSVLSTLSFISIEANHQTRRQAD